MFLAAGLLAFRSCSHEDEDSWAADYRWTAPKAYDYDISTALGTTPASYEILTDSFYDTPIKTQVYLKILITEDITESSVRNILTELFTKVDQLRGFRYHTKPTHVFIYAYPDKERAKPETAAWVGMLSKYGGDEQAQIATNKKLIAQLKLPPIDKFGFSEAERKKIYKEIIHAASQAFINSDRIYPLYPEKTLTVGQSFLLTHKTPLMPKLEPADPLTALGKIRDIPAGVTILIHQVAKKLGDPWYFVTVSSPNGRNLGVGWINSVALYGQAKVDIQKQLRKQGRLEDILMQEYLTELAAKHGLTLEQLEQISFEGYEKRWPSPADVK